MNRVTCTFALILLLVAPMLSFMPGPPVHTASGKKSAPAVKWTIDKSRSAVNFSVTHLVVSKAEGLFKTFEGSMESSKPDFSDARVSFTIKAASIDTDNETRDKHLRSADYFDVEKYPEIRFESTSFQPSGGKKYKLAGNLTIKDVTRPVVWEVIYTGSGDSDKGSRAVFSATTIIDRYEYNIKSGGAAIGKEVTITVKAEMILSK